ncbi:lytic murein transglycosylase B [Candidatus Vallotia cooleyia]|uniref:lytic murein transglycosylase B n=1 Tax=Candidatus Vallotiella adelgis TaxID=1177211 RepID=UPI001D02AF91|nr:lytic murein transglycosylase B [Candidatus Vallotia cooleyia]UDG82069.1 Membrane-bound lytic murein transglycosylase B [Candidatus Vallotia cooleyia]
MTRWLKALLCTFATTHIAVASGSSPKIVVVQAQSESSVLQSQMFEEEIVPQCYADNSHVDAFINDMVSRHNFDSRALHALFNQAVYSKTAAKLVLGAKTPILKSWQAYQARLIDAVRINTGVRFWQQNKAVLQKASKQFGVPPEVIVSIIGVETLYGQYMGHFRVLDALTTLTFDYPDTSNRTQRMSRFRKELEDFLVWTRSAGIKPTTVLGSYTGAIGIPQFLPSSIVEYAIDYEGDDHIDLRNSFADAIGSVANYLKQHGWESDRPIVWRVHMDTGSIGIAKAALDKKAESRWALQQLLHAGMLLDERTVDIASEAETPVSVVELLTSGQPAQYILGLKNFHVLTRYNHSFFYAAAVYELSERIKTEMRALSEMTAQPAIYPVR